MTNTLTFDFDEAGIHRSASIGIDTVVIAGWTGRDADGIAHHIAELQAIGIPPPSKVPLFYRVSSALLTQAERIQVVGEASSGEIEPVLFRAHGSLWLTLGSDHTDRALECHGIAMAKQACAKPVARHAWRFDELIDRLDSLALQSTIEAGNGPEIYQDGVLERIRALPGLLADMHRETGLPETDGIAMFCGTLPAIGAIRGARRFSGQLHDPTTQRRIALDYRIETLPVVA